MTQRTTDTKFKKLFRLLTSFLIIVLLSSAFIPAFAEAKTETTTLRIISTGDLHGQLTTTNYDKAGEHTGSLAQVHTLIKQARKEIKNGAVLTVDTGDTIYGYGTDYVISTDGTEYMYKAMKEVGYDAITLGNHDFDYGYKYVKNQLKDAGLSNLCVLSNVYSVETGNTVWNENKIITKKMKTSAGRTISVKIGIAGVTVPSLSTYSSHTGVLTAKDMTESVKEQVKKLKAKGTDVIVVLAHGSMGNANPEPNTENAIYAISKVDGVDAIMFGHPHVNFPSTDNNVSSYYSLSGVNKKTGLVNGIPVVSVKDHGTAIGIADLTLSVSSSGKVSVKKSSAKLSYVESSTALSSAITKYKSLYEAEIKDTYDEIVGSLEDAASVTNYFGLLSDNKALQLTNEAKIQLGLSYINTEYSQYADYPVIAASNYKKYGKESYSDYINVSGHITVGDILSIQSYNHEYTSLYQITGAQLKEWLEYCASAYEKTGTSKKWSDDNINHYVKNMDLSPVLMPEWMDNWSNFSIFDGIEYEIDTSQPARYDVYGNYLNYGYSRISNLTCNGKPVTDDMKFVLVCDVITASRPVIGAELINQRIKKTDIHSSILLKDYISKQMEFGAIPGSADNNWYVDFPTSGNYLVRSSSLSTSEGENQPWYAGLLQTTKNYAYYQAAFTKKSFQDSNGPTLVLSPTIEVDTNKQIPVIVHANDMSGIVSCKYVQGYHDADDSIWNMAGIPISGNRFIAASNGIYSVLAIDYLGNKTVKYINISNINPSILQIPAVDKYTNRKSAITGTGEPNSTIHFSCKTGNYETKVAADGTFSYELPPQEADSVVKVHLTDGMGRKSAIVNVNVARTGPNYPDVDNVTNKSSKITGDLKDKTSQVFAVIGSKVYVAKDGGKEAYTASTRYDSSKTIVPTKFVTYGTEFELTIPIQRAGTTVRVYSVDKIGRTNQVTKLKTEDVAPNQPVIFTACNAENHVFGYVPKAQGIYDIKVTIGSDRYTATTDANGYFTIETDNLQENDTIDVTASDTIDGVKRTSAKGSRTVSAYSKFMKAENRSGIILSPMTNKDTIITGEILSGQVDALYLKVNETCYTIRTNYDGTFSFELPEPLVPGSSIYVVHRDEYSNIKETAKVTVTLALPETPQLLTETIYNNTTSVSLLSKDLCTANIKINGKVYKTEKATYDETLDGYIYIIEIDKCPAESIAYIYMENASGKSDRLKTEIVAKIPEISDLSEVTTKDRKVTGIVTLVLPETKVYAKVKEKGKDDKTYEGTIKADGTFKIVFDEKPAKDAKIVIWAENANGKCDKITITVTEAEKKK